MSRASGQLTTRSKPTSRQGTIHTENPELLKLLRENSADIKANRQFQKKKNSSPTKGKKVASDRSVDSKKKSNSGGSVDLKPTKQLFDHSKKEDADSGHFEGEDFLISDSGDAKAPQSGRDTFIVPAPQKARRSRDAAGDSMSVSNKENISDPSTGNTKRAVSVNWDSEVYDKNVPGDSVQASQKSDDEQAVGNNNSENVANEKSIEKKDSLEQDNDQFVLSDINESDRDTLGSSSSELARLRSPSRKSLNPDIEGSPVPSSPVHPPREEDNSRGNNLEEDRESSTPVGIDARAAGATPHPSSRRPVSRTPTPEATTPVGEVQEPEPETLADTEPVPAPAPADPYDVYRKAAPPKVNDQKNPDTTSNAGPAPKRKDPYDLKRTTNNPEKATDSKSTTEPTRKDPYNIYQTSVPSKSEQPNGDKPHSNTDTNQKGNTSPIAPEKAKTATPANAPPAQAVSTAAPATAPVTNSPVPQAAAGQSPSPNKSGPAYSSGSPRQSKASFRPTPGPTEILTPRGNQKVTAVNPKLLENSIEDKSLHLEETSHPRFTVPYSSSRLKSRGDAAKRSGSVATSSEIPVSPSEGKEISKLVPDSLDIERDSLEVDQEEKEDRGQEQPNAEKGFEDQSEENEAVETHIQDSEQQAALSKLAESENRNDNVETVNEEPELAKGEPQKQTIVPNFEKETIVSEDAEESQKQTIASNRENSQQGLEPQFQRERSLTEDTLKYDKSGALSVNQQEQQLPPPTIDVDTVKPEEEPSDNVEFVIKSDPYKQNSSRYSSAQGSGRFSNTLRRNSEPTRGTPLVVGSAAKHSNRTTPSSKKVYVESPTFTREEEEEYRFVSSRLDDVEEEKADTYRELDMAAIQTREGYAPMAAPKMQTEKRVRYSDMEGRYEDRDRGMNGGGGEDPGYSKASRGYGNMNENDDADEYGYGEPVGFERQNDRYPEDPRNRDYEQQQAFQRQQPPPHPQQQLQQQQRQQQPQPQPQQYGGGDGYGNGNPGGYGNQNNQPQMFGNPNQQGYSSQSQGYPQQQGYNPSNQEFSNQQQYGGHNPQQQQMQQQPDGYSRQFQQPQPSGNVSNQPPYQQQQQPFHQAPQPQPAPQEQKKPPVRGLSLPTGPSYDPVDEEELLRETTYQQGLRLRIADGNRRAEETAIPQLPFNQDQGQGHPRFDSQDFVQDSLDNDPNEDTFRSYGSGLPQDSLEMYGRPQHHHPQNHFRNPPPLPQPFAGHNNNNQFQGSRLNNVNFDSEDYADYEDIRQPRVNPQVQPRFYNPQLDPQRGNANNGAFPESGQTTERSDGDTFRGMQRYEDRNDNEEEEPPMEAVHPKPPKYDYVNNNKDDYGKQAPKSYKRIHEITKEEKDRLNDIFIQPKPKGKGGILKKKGQGQSQGRQDSQFSDLQPQGQYMEQDPAYEDMTPAEQMWAQRSASLAKKFDPNANKGRRKGPGGLQKYNSDSSLSQAPLPQRRDGFQPTPQQRQQQPQQQQQHPNQQQLMIQPQGGRVAPDKRAFITEMPTPVNERGYQNQVALPISPRQPEIQLHPISQQIITEDGQRISVDVNLKLISPPPHAGGSPPQQQQQHHPQQQYYPYQQQQQQQQQVPQHPPPQYYGGGRGRQYPAVTNYDEDGGGYGDYNPQDYDESNEYRYISPRERYSADEALRALNNSRTEMNPYGKIPPIPRSSGSEHPSSAPIPDQGGSYMDMYIKQKVKDGERPWYRVYGLKDYRKMQKEVRLGTLGPDLDSDAVKERKEKVARQNDYAKIVMERNRNELAHRKPPSFPRPKEENDIMNRRKVAVEYAKSVPKPTVKIQPNEFNNYEMASEKSPIARHHRRADDGSISGSQKNLSPSPSQPRKKKEPEMDVLNLEKLRQRYEEDKQNEAIIRRNTGSAKGEKYY